MAYPFTPAQQTELEALRAAGNYSDVYKYILFHTSTFSPVLSAYTEVNLTNVQSATPVSGVDDSVWLWTRGAYGVNSDDGSFFSDFIRDYTAEQHFLRYGTAIGSTEVDLASDIIANAFAVEIIGGSGSLPDLNTVGFTDAGPVASEIFSPTEISALTHTTNYSPWAGTILFPFLGEGSFFRDWVLTTDTVQKSGTEYYKALEGTYDLISIAATANAITTQFEAWWNSGALIDTIENNTGGEAATLALLDQLRAEANAFFQSVYALPDIELTQIGGDLPLYGNANILNWADAFENGIQPNYIVGTLDDDAIIQTNSLAVAGLIRNEDIVHAGLGADFIEGSEGDDLIDGGKGLDTLDYSGLSNTPFTAGITVNFETILSLNNYFDHRVVINDPGFLSIGNFTDYAYDIERLNLTNAKDTVVFNPSVSMVYEIDGKGGNDTLDYSAYTTEVNVNLAASSDSLGNTLSNFETIILSEAGGEANGSLYAESIYGSMFNDIITGAGGSDAIYGFAGDDILSVNINDAASNSYIDGGEGIDFFKANGGNLILNNGIATSQTGIAENIEGLIASGNNDYIYIETMGWQFDANNDRMSWLDYSAINQSIDFDFSSSLIWTATETTGSNPSFDVYTNVGSSGGKLYGPRIVGSNKGDTYNFDAIEYHNVKLQLGLGNDVVNVESYSGDDTVFEFSYLGGDDVINFLDTYNAYSWNIADGSKIILPSNIDVSDVTISRSNEILYSEFVGSGGNPPSKTYVFDLTVAVSGLGTITIDNLLYTRKGGSDWIYGNIDDYYDHAMPDISIMNGGYFRVQGTPSIFGSGDFEYVGATSFPSLSGTANNDILTGTSNGDFLYGYGGDDIINGVAGFNRIYGHGGNDVLNGGDDGSNLYGDLGDDVLNGGASQDALYGGQGSDVLNGGLQSDNLYGGNGDDELSGDEGNDILYGNWGDDTLKGGEGNDYLYGEAGDDTYYFSVNFGQDHIIDTSGIDTIKFNLSLSEDDLIQTQSGDNLILTFIDNIVDRITIVDYFDLDNPHLIENFIFNQYNNIAGTSASENISGTLGADEIFGYEGDDVLAGAAGDDILIGGLGNDIYEFNIGDGVNTVIEDGGFDALKLGSGILASDLSFSQVDNDLHIQIASGFIIKDFYSGNEDALVEQINFADGSVFDLTSLLNPVSIITGTSGNDTSLNGTVDDDEILGFGGNDILRGQEGADILDGGDGIDRASYTQSSAAVIVNLANSSLNTGEAAGDVYISIEDIQGSRYDDVISGDDQDNRLWGYNGNDELHGLGGKDRIFGQNGDDSLYGGDDDDILWGGLGADVINGGAGIDRASYSQAKSLVVANLSNASLNAGEALGDTYFSIENLQGSSHDDQLSGDANVNTIWGYNGNDTISGLDGNDKLFGQDGDDNLLGDDGDDILWGGLGADVLNGGAGIDRASYSQATSLVIANLTNVSVNAGEALGDSYISIENLQGSRYSDELTGNADANTIWGYDGDDVISGLGDNDRLFGQNGNDALFGGEGDDLLWGGVGADALDGGEGEDRATYTQATGNIKASLLNTSFNTGEARGDTYISIENIQGSRYADTLIGDHADNKVWGYNGADILFGNDGDDRLYGQNDNDTLYGGNGVDRLYGGDADDILYGEADNDYLIGGAGDDIFYGGAGNDYMRGDDGADKFVISGVETFGALDRIADFDVSEGDWIEFSSSILSGYDPVDDAITDFITLTETATHTYINVDRDGTGPEYSAEQVVRIQNVTGQWSDVDDMITSGDLIVV